MIGKISNNSVLKKLHMERQQRVNSTQQVPEFECPVCYTDGTEFGTAIPKCGHKICLSCYSNILLRGGDKTLCPCCRTPYCKPVINEVDDHYDELPQLVPALTYEQYIMLSRLTLADSLHGERLMSLLSDMNRLANSLDGLIEPDEV